VQEARPEDEHAFPAGVAVQRLQHAAEYVDPRFIPERALREDPWMHVSRNFHTQSSTVPAAKCEPRTACSDFERRPVMPTIR
jgi:hypothetical protein